MDPPAPQAREGLGERGCACLPLVAAVPAQDPLPASCSLSGHPVSLQGGVPRCQARNASYAGRVGGGGAPPAGARGSGRTPCSLPRNTAGSELSGAVAWKDCSLGPGTRSQPTGDPTCKWGPFPTGDRWVN